LLFLFLKKKKDTTSIRTRAFLFKINIMEKIYTQITISNIGIGSASGLIHRTILVISDNSTFLYEYSIRKKELSKIKLFENSQDNIPKTN
jgi:hypothetical protein